MNLPKQIVSEDQQTCDLTPRRRGRPRASEPKNMVSAWVTSRQHDRLASLASSRGVSVSEVIRLIMAVSTMWERK